MYASLGALANLGEYPRRMAQLLPSFNPLEAICAALGRSLVIITVPHRAARAFRSWRS